MDITQIPGLSGWPGMVVTLFAMLIYAWHTNRSVKSKISAAQEESAKKAEDVAKQANKDAIEAMQQHLNILRERVNEAEKENVRMHQTIETIYSALKSRGIYITIEGDAVHIRDNGNSTTIRMKKDE